LQLSCNFTDGDHSITCDDVDVSVKFLRFGILVLACFLFLTVAASAGDRPHFITYDHTMEEPGNPEIEASGLS
jgi:hypothetical protein